jgi:hypothetical protein
MRRNASSETGRVLHCFQSVLVPMEYLRSTTMNVYGAAMADDMREANSKVVGMILQ